MSADYWLGFATPFALAVSGFVILMVLAWIAWWFRDPAQFRGGWGYTHEVQTIFPENGRWGTVQHTHWWPPDTFRWLGRLLEPVRIWWCLRSPDYREAPKPHDDRHAGAEGSVAE